MPGSAGGALPARPVYYDRNAVAHGEAHSYTAASPFGQLAAFVYTIPSTSKGYLEAAHISIFRSVAAGVVGRTYGLIYVWATSDATFCHVLEVDMTDNTVDAFVQDSISLAVYLAAGDQVEGDVADQSTGGTVDIVTEALFAVFDF